MKFKNLVISGNSFTQDGIGVFPPTLSSAEGCSFFDDSNYKLAVLKVWTSWIASKLQVTSS
jgi:hypothetical protein